MLEVIFQKVLCLLPFEFSSRSTALPLIFLTYETVLKNSSYLATTILFSSVSLFTRASQPQLPLSKDKFWNFPTTIHMTSVHSTQELLLGKENNSIVKIPKEGQSHHAFFLCTHKDTQTVPFPLAYLPTVVETSSLAGRSLALGLGLLRL
ncbi:hypothetical protein Tco_0949462 [Tanacetum coccineum]